MAIDFTGVRFKPFQDISFLDNMDITQLKNYLIQEQKDVNALQSHLVKLRDKAKEQLQSFKVESIKFETTDFNNQAEKARLINQIKEARMKKLALMAAKKQMEMILKAADDTKKAINAPDKLISILKNLGADNDEIQKALVELGGNDYDYDEIREWHEDYQIEAFENKMIEEGYQLIDRSEAESYFIGAE